MQECETVGQALIDARIIAIVRRDQAAGLVETCLALAEGGVRAVEIPLTTPGALEAIERLAGLLPERCVLGAGSVRDAGMLRRAADAGARFMVSPIHKPELIEAGHARGCAVMPGALTPTEIALAHEAGADVVKVFPADCFGPGYIKDVLAPMPELKLAPTGGVTLENLHEWFAAGAACVGVGSSLVRGDLIEAEDWAGLSAVAKEFVEAVR